MTLSDDPPSCMGGSADGSKVLSFPATEPSIPSHNHAALQAEIVAFPHRRGRPRPRLREIRITAIAGCYPYEGKTRAFQLTDHGLDELLAIAERLEAARRNGWHPHRNDIDAGLAALRAETVP